MNDRIGQSIDYNKDLLLSYLILEKILSGKIINRLLDIYKHNYNEIISFLEFLLEENDIDDIENIVIGYLDIYDTSRPISREVNSIVGEYIN